MLIRKLNYFHHLASVVLLNNIASVMFIHDKENYSAHNSSTTRTFMLVSRYLSKQEMAIELKFYILRVIPYLDACIHFGFSH